MADNNDYAFKIKQGSKVKLKDYKADYNGGLTKEDAAEHFEKYHQELTELQELLYAAGHNSLLIVLQGMDTSGKDGTVEHVMSSMNPQGVQVSSFKAPTSEELGHDFLWRVHRVTPAKGWVGIFNRSHYEDVLVVAVHDLQPPEVVKGRYDSINNFEKLLADNGTIILKFFLHISQEEQMERLLAREEDQSKQWKLAVGDYREREFWDTYQKYYEKALEKCSTDYAPWWIIPADRKWYRNLAVAETIVEQLRPYKEQWRKALEERGAAAMKLLTEARANGSVPPAKVEETIVKEKNKKGSRNSAKKE